MERASAVSPRGMHPPVERGGDHGSARERSDARVIAGSRGCDLQLQIERETERERGYVVERVERWKEVEGGGNSSSSLAR